MQILPVYRYQRPDGGVTVSPIQPECAYTTLYRLVADEGKALTQDGISTTACADVEHTDGWYEVDETEEAVPC